MAHSDDLLLGDTSMSSVTVSELRKQLEETRKQLDAASEARTQLLIVTDRFGISFLKVLVHFVFVYVCVCVYVCVYMCVYVCVCEKACERVCV